MKLGHFSALCALLGVALGACAGPQTPRPAHAPDPETDHSVARVAAPDVLPPAPLPAGPLPRAIRFSFPGGPTVCAEPRPELSQLSLSADADTRLRFEERVWLESWFSSALPELAEHRSACSQIACFDVPLRDADALLHKLGRALDKVEPAALELARTRAQQRLRRVEMREGGDVWELVTLVATAPLDPPGPWGSPYLNPLTHEQARRLLQGLEFTLRGPFSPEAVKTRFGASDAGARPAAAARATKPPTSAEKPRLLWLDVDTGEAARAVVTLVGGVPSPDQLERVLELVRLRLAGEARRVGVQISVAAGSLRLSGSAVSLPALVRRAHEELDRVDGVTAQELARTAVAPPCADVPPSAARLEGTTLPAQRRTLVIGAQEALEGAFGPEAPLTLVDPKIHRLSPAPPRRPAPVKADESPDY